MQLHLLRERRIKRVAIHYVGCEPFEVEALSEERLRQLIVVECQDRGWLIEDSWREELA